MAPNTSKFAIVGQREVDIPTPDFFLSINVNKSLHRVVVRDESNLNREDPITSIFKNEHHKMNLKYVEQYMS